MTFSERRPVSGLYRSLIRVNNDTANHVLFVIKNEFQIDLRAWLVTHTRLG